jgi:aspartyl-tRNA(Asn)/glutamyl-tRNA(Gln) amidotransferase subunit A
MSELIRKNASELVELLKSGQVSSVELTQVHLDRSAAVDQDVHSYLYQNPETALARGQGQPDHHRRANHFGFKDPRGLDSALRLNRCEAHP